MNVGRVVENAALPTMWPRNLSGVGTVADAGRWIDELRRDPRIGELLLDLRGVFLIDFLRGRLRAQRLDGNTGGDERQCDGMLRRIDRFERDILSPCTSSGAGVGRVARHA
jgi:hypothetical protein